MAILFDGAASVPADLRVELTAEQGRELRRLEREIEGAQVVAWLESWTLERPIPQTVDDLGDLEADAMERARRN